MPIYKDMTLKPVERKIVNVKEGEIFFFDRFKFEVIKVYSHYALCRRLKDGKLESFTVGDFVLIGMEKPEPTKQNCFFV